MEREPFERLAADGQMMGYIHEAFWSCMDTLRDKNRLEALWRAASAVENMEGLNNAENRNVIFS